MCNDCPLCGTKARQEMVNVLQKNNFFLSFVGSYVGMSFSTEHHYNEGPSNAHESDLLLLLSLMLMKY
jgi:hypothetical protein